MFLKSSQNEQNTMRFKGSKWEERLHESFLQQNNCIILEFPEIGCTNDDTCPVETACINGICKNPCSEVNLCQADQECQVHNHDMVCVKGECSCFIHILP